MPRALIIPDADTLLSSRPGVKLYYLDRNDDAPLYRRCKMIGDAPLFGNRRAAYLSWIIHRGEFARGGDAWQLMGAKPELFQWAGELMAANFDMGYLAEAFDLSQAQIDALIAAERAKYGKSKG